jgi:hypothetical protein
MSPLEEILQSINEAYAQLDGVTPVQVSTQTTVHDYLQLMDVLHAQSLKLADEAISKAIAAGQFVDTTATVTILRGLREQLVELNFKVHKNLDGLGSNLTLEQVWADITGGTPEPDPDDDTDPVDPGDDGNTGGNDDTPVIYPDPGTVVLYGDTPMLLRANDPDVVIGTAFTLDSTALVTTSPVFSFDEPAAPTIGTHTSPSLELARETGINTFVSAFKGLFGQIFETTGFYPGTLAIKVDQIYGIGKWMTGMASEVGSIMLDAPAALASGNTGALLERIDTMLEKRASDADRMAATELVSSLPGGSYTAGPVVDSALELSAKMQIRNSFELSITAQHAMQGGDKGAVFIAGDGNDEIFAGNGDVLAHGGDGMDTFHPGIGKQWFAGGNGFDQVIYNSSGANQVINLIPEGYRMNAATGEHTFSGIERIRFSDRKVALDLGQNESAGKAVRLVGAALDAPALTPQLVGWFINEFDQGYTMQEAIQHAMQTPQFITLMPPVSDTEFVTRVFHNVTGVQPSPDQLDYFRGLLTGQGGTMSQTDLLVLAANAGANALNIDLVGLQQHGIDYL